MQLLLIVLLSLAAVIIGPLLTIWSVNTLFAAGIGYSFNTWAATALLVTVFGGVTASAKVSA